MEITIMKIRMLVETLAVMVTVAVAMPGVACQMQMLVGMVAVMVAGMVAMEGLVGRRRWRASRL
jgi:hypothetical protein